MFEKHRESQNAVFDPEHFLDFLLVHSEKSQSIRNSFKGLRRLNAFLEAVQMEFGVCFSQEEIEKNWGLKEFSALLERKQKNRNGSLNAAKRKLREAESKAFSEPIKVFIAVAVISGLFSGLWTRTTVKWVVPMVAGSLAAFLAGLLQWKEIRFYKKLVSSISHDKAIS